MICYRVGDGAIETKADRNGAPYYVHQRPDIPADGTSTSLPPMLPTTPTGQFKRADVDTLHTVYLALLQRFILSVGRGSHASALLARGLSPDEIRRREYRTLPLKGRYEKATELQRKFSDLLTVPGFIIKAGERGDYLTISGKPGLLVPVRDVQGRIVALKVRPDQNGGGGKYVYLSSKKHGGPGPGSPIHVPLGIAGPHETIRVTEGELKADVATALSSMATISIPGVTNWRPAFPVLRDLGATTVRLAFDADAATKEDVARSLLHFSQKLVAEGFTVELERWPDGAGKGIDDVLAAGQAELIETLVGDAAAQAIRETALAAGVDPDAPSPPDQPFRPRDSRTTIEIVPDEHLVNDEAAGALANDQGLFQRGGELVHILRNVELRDGIARPEGTPRIVVVPSAQLRERLTAVVRFVKMTEGENGLEEKHVHPPEWCIRAVGARGRWPNVRPLTGIVDCPVLRPDGTVLQTPGYDTATGLLLEPSGDWDPIPESPTRTEAERAIAALLEVVCDFPFATLEHQSGWLASLLTPLARYAFSGPAPLFLIDANIRASGKSLLADVVSLIVSGRTAPRMANPGDDDEARKRITAVALAGDPLLLIDNIAAALGSPSLDAVLTGDVWRDRLLGKSEMVTMPMRTTWYATGNNVILIGDTSRRVVHVRLNSPLENPETRKDLRNPDLRRHVREHRPRLLAAALTLLRAWFVAGRPQSDLHAWGSFEGWSDLVRQVIVWCGRPDPARTRQQLVESSDREAGALRELITGFDELDPDCSGLTSADIIQKLETHRDQYQLARNSLAELCPKLTPRSVGNKLRHLRGRVVAGRAIDERPTRTGAKAWRVVIVGSQSADSDDSAESGSPGAGNREHPEPGIECENGSQEAGQEEPADPAESADAARAASDMHDDEWGEV